MRLAADNRTQFTANAFKQFIKRNGAGHHSTSPGHPATNGAAENLVGTFKCSIKAVVRIGRTVDEAVNEFQA